MKSNGVNAVFPGSMRTRSMPRRRNSGQIRSTSSHATNSVPRETEGAARLAARATAKWPMNTLARRAEERLLEVLLDRLVPEPDAQQRAVEVLARDRRAGRLAVDAQLRRLAVPAERDEHSFLRLLHLGHHRSELLDLRLERARLGFGMILADALGERAAELLGAHVAQHPDVDALR